MNFTETAKSLLHLFFPHCCAGCSSDIISNDQLLCLSCISRLPLTNFHLYADNPVQHIFRGRLPLVNATSYLYFTKDSLLQHLMHQFKYNNRKDIGTWFGKRIGESLRSSNHFTLPDALVPIPLFAARERKRGYNQSQVLCAAMAEIMGIPVLNNIVVRSILTETQTRKNRLERWQNMEGRFSLQHAAEIENKHVLLVDDVITTGATLEACGLALLTANNVKLSIATMGFASR
ncbi:ComF family protein [Paraflavitalea speifideaquila]|uniref:ComF family protein n=1 Tax=Paraflavitalea speifideaquila TaxID=3076558 RepID=UPI0028EE921C|nr:ComF family protein [Paraflavitalea speifideiaquila]